MRKWITGALLMLVAPTALWASDPLPGWMAGAWDRQATGEVSAVANNERWGDEFWTPPRGGIMIGSGRSGRGTRLGSFESMRIGYDEAGKLAFWAFPQWSETPTKFLMTKQSEAEITFENAQHDYPQRVRYWLDGRLLKAEISLIDGSSAAQFSFEPMGQK